MLKKTIKNFASKVGINLVSKYDRDRETKYLQILDAFSLKKNTTKIDGCSIVIFSKDRAMQLDGLLRSYFHFVENTAPVYILFQASNVAFKKGYDIVKKQYDNNVFFTSENHFKNDLVDLFTEIHTSKVLFLVDDIMFKSTLNLASFATIDPKKFVASLRMGRHLNFSYTLQRAQELPDFGSQDKLPNMLIWSYKKGVLDWSYPLSVDGHLFDTHEISILVKELDYKAPNSFEEALQLMLPYYSLRKGLCFEKSIIINNPCNKVQTENDNVFGAITIEELNKKWLNGYRINFEEYEGLINESAHQELALNFVKR